MAMTGAGLKAAIKAVVNPPASFDDTQLNLICQAIVQYIQNNAVVSGSISVTSVSGVTTGLSASGPGTGTLSGGTIS